MKLNNFAKIVLGILTFLPLLFVILTAGIMFVNIFSMMFSQDLFLPMMALSYLSHVLPYLFFIVLLALGLLIFYIVHIIQNSLLDTEKRMLWIAIVFLGYGIALPIYWYLHIWNANPSDPITNEQYEPRT